MQIDDQRCPARTQRALSENQRSAMNHPKEITITDGTTNVFEDLGLPDAAERQTKTRLAFAVNKLIQARGLKQREAAEVLGIPQPKVSALKNYRLDQFSVEKLMELLTALDHDVDIMIRPRAAAGTGHIAVLTVQ